MRSLFKVILHMSRLWRRVFLIVRTIGSSVSDVSLISVEVLFW